VNGNGTPIDPAVVERLKRGDWQFGHAGRHHGTGAPDCPRELHHHHDEFCSRPTMAELRAAGIDPADFKPRSRA
jgi:hypothetical protein